MREPVVKVLDAAQRLVTGPALVPDRFDRHKTFLSAAQVQKLAHDFARRGLVAKLMHQKTGDFSSKLAIVETWLLREPLIWTAEAPTDEPELESDSDSEVSKEADGSAAVAEALVLPVGTWMVTMKIFDDAIWAGVLAGTYRGFSVGGRAVKIPMPEEEGSA